MKRLTNKMIEKGHTIKVLNAGHVTLVDWMGSDERICEAARVSYGDATKRSNDRNLIRYMLNHDHGSPFEMCSVTFKIKLPIFVARQMVRHRTAKINECSGRYSELPADFYDYSLQGFPKQSQTNKQGSETEQIDDCDLWIEGLHVHNDNAFEIYRDLLNEGCAKEIARCHLPLSTYTEWYWQCDLRNLFNFFRLRMDSHAQAEIRVYAEAMYEMVKELFPLACEAFEDYILNSMKLSAMEVKALAYLISPHIATKTLEEENERQGWGMSNREIQAFQKKLARLGW